MISDYKLPNILPVYLCNFIFFPNTSVPLRTKIIEMINDSKKNRIIGLVQPKSFKSNNIYSIGCAGKITSFNETDDNRIILVLNGISRFKILNYQMKNYTVKLALINLRMIY